MQDEVRPLHFVLKYVRSS